MIILAASSRRGDGPKSKLRRAALSPSLTTTRQVGFLLLLLILSYLPCLARSWLLPSIPSPRRTQRACLYASSLPSSSSTSGGQPQQQPPLSLLEGDVVEYKISDAQRAKGQLPPNDKRQLGVGVVNALGGIHPLCRRAPDTLELFFDEEQDAIEGEDVSQLVVRVLSQVWYQQRCIEDRKLNPHGEEAEDMYIVEEPLSPGCGPAERY